MATAVSPKREALRKWCVCDVCFGDVFETTILEDGQVVEVLPWEHAYPADHIIVAVPAPLVQALQRQIWRSHHQLLSDYTSGLPVCKQDPCGRRSGSVCERCDDFAQQAAEGFARDTVAGMMGVCGIAIPRVTDQGGLDG